MERGQNERDRASEKYTHEGQINLRSVCLINSINFHGISTNYSFALRRSIIAQQTGLCWTTTSFVLQDSVTRARLSTKRTAFAFLKQNLGNRLQSFLEIVRFPPSRRTILWILFRNIVENLSTTESGSFEDWFDLYKKEVGSVARWCFYYHIRQILEQLNSRQSKYTSI